MTVLIFTLFMAILMSCVFFEVVVQSLLLGLINNKIIFYFHPIKFFGL